MVGEFATADLAYLAGLIDGEGSIVLGWRWTTKNKPKRYRYMQLRLDIANSNLAVLAWAQRLFPGVSSVIHEAKRTRAHAHWKPVFHVMWSGGAAATVLSAVYPYLKIKKGQAELALKFQATKVKVTRLGVPADVQRVRDEIEQSIRAANAKGVAERRSF